MSTWYAVGSALARVAKDHWTHGTVNKAFDRFDLSKNREGDPNDDTYEDDEPKHWNSHLGAHFTSIHDVANGIVAETGMGRIIHASLAMKNPKHYKSEYDLDKDGYQHGVEMGHFPKGDVTSGHAQNRLTGHPKIKKIAKSFKANLQSQGYDGITYGNEYEGPKQHKCAIAFHSDDIKITHQHSIVEPCDQSDICQNKVCQEPMPKGQVYCDSCDTRQRRVATKKPGLTGYPIPEEYGFYDDTRAAAGAPGRPGAHQRGDGSRGAQAIPGRLRPSAVVAGRCGTGGDGPVGDLVSDPHTIHSKVAKDIKAMDPQVRKKARQGIKDVVASEQLTMSHTHGLKGGMKGWNSSEVNGAHGYRVIHQPNDKGGIHIGYVGLHEYGDAQQRLSKVRQVPQDGPPQTGIMVAIVPPASVVEDLVLEEGEGAHELHITLAYLGNISEYSEALLDSLHEVVESWAEDQAKFTALVQGVGTFLAASEDEQHVLWASIGAPRLHRLQASLVDHLKDHGYHPRENHGFCAHLTLSYGKHHFRFMPKVKRQEFVVHEIWVCAAGRWESIALQGKVRHSAVCEPSPLQTRLTS